MVKKNHRVFGHAVFCFFSGSGRHVGLERYFPGGDGLASRLDAPRMVIYGGLLGATGLFLAVLTPWIVTSLIGFVMLGVGAANLVPVFFSEAGRLKDVSSSTAITAITTFGYAGQLVGPAALGFIAERLSLPFALACTGLLLLMVSGAYVYRKYVDELIPNVA